ncbi:MAG TPA: class I SAM-dependent methyltransferase [Blastocatellia bacterium]|nr:class I SAM-dependent methyltransferase [Blastocatellia bacterium]
MLLRFCHDPNRKESLGATHHYTIENALDFPLKMVPDLISRIQGQNILDYGCGPGWQAVIMAQKGAESVTGIDIVKSWVDHANGLASQYCCTEKARFLHADEFWAEKQNLNRFDLTFSCGSFEHFSEPEKELERMKQVTRDGGSILITFAEPWLSPHGAHMYGMIDIPYINILVPERVVMSLRSRYKDDGAKHYEEIQGGLNKMTLKKFERIIRNSGLKVDYLRYTPTKNLPLVDKIPFVREFLVSAVTCLLRK